MFDPLRWFESLVRCRELRGCRQPAARQRSAISQARRPSLESLESRELLTVTYHGGQLLSNVEAQPVYLGSDWAINSTLQVQTAAIDQFMSSLVQSPYMDMLTQAGYNVGRGTATSGKELGGVNKSTGITDAQIRSDLQAGISSSQLAVPDANRLYVVYVEPGVVIRDGNSTSQNSFLGYHGAFAGTDASGHSVDIHYAVVAYPGSPNPSASSQGFVANFDQLTDVTSHELAEAVTDPNVNYKALGWYDTQRNGEIGDLTNRTSVLNGYVVQDVVNKSDRVIAPTANSPRSLIAPRNVAATATSSTQATVSWTAASGASGYRVYLVNGTQTTLVATVGASATSATVTGLAPGATESFKVEAFSGTMVADSNTVSVTMPSQPSQTGLSAPHAVATAISYNAVQLSWGATSGAEGYRIYWMNGNQPVLLGTVSAAPNSVVVTGFSGGQTAQLMVEAVSGSVVADSLWVAATTPPTPWYWGYGWWWT
jgi:hypothetical protein